MASFVRLDFYWWGMLMDKVNSNKRRTEIKQKKK